MTNILLVRARCSWLVLFLLLAGGNWNNALNAGPVTSFNDRYNINQNKYIGMSRPLKYGITKELLEELHFKRELTPYQIADYFGCTQSLILHYFKKYNLEKLPKYQRIVGERYGRLVVTRFIGIGTEGALWECVCDCGNIITSSAASLNFGKVKSCGCLSVEVHSTHNMSGTRPYSIWQGMKTRCNNPNAINYSGYGGRGITIDPKWEVFEHFWEDMKDGYDDSLSIERINNERGYCRENCVWADKRTQNFNKRSNVDIVYNKERRTITEWAEILQIDRRTLYYLKKKGLPDEQIITKVMNKEV
ncbi:MAG: hypothetical protein WC936_03520 [Candidatus Nanoarchaeia archaeon]|jgi:hypothetical protein